MYSLLLFLLLPLLINADKYIKVKNNCKSVLSVGVLTNGAHSDTKQLFDLKPTETHQFTRSNQWGGRVWAREGCSGSNVNINDCQIPGAANPASLAEFFFKGVYGQDFYDISLVDGYNLPVKIQPTGGTHVDGYYCGAIECRIESCPQRYAITGVTGDVISCQSSCSATNMPEDCCTGSYDHPHICKGGEHSINVKKQCPEAYSFAYDDATSTFACSSDGYIVTFC